MIRSLAVATVALLALAPAARAQGRRPPPSVMERCDQRGGSNPEIQDCVADASAKEDARLNRAYQAALSRLTPREKIGLRDTQRGWIKDRDAACDVYLDEAQYGRQGRIEAENCVYEWTRDRADELERLYPLRRLR